MNPESAIQFLGPRYTNPHVRKYAAFRIAQLTDTEIELYLLQLVQALRFENFDFVKIGLQRELMNFFEETEEEEAQITLKKAKKFNSCSNLNLTSSYPCGLSNRHSTLKRSNSSVTLSRNWHHLEWKAQKLDALNSWKYSCSDHNFSLIGHDLATLLVDRCSQNFRLANYFYWFILTECESTLNDINVQEMYLIVLKRFLMKLEHGNSVWNKQFHLFQQQYKIVTQLIDVIKQVKALGVSRPKKLENLKEKLVLPRKSIGSSFADFPPIPLPLDPSIFIDGILPSKTQIFKSATLPCKFYLRKSHTESSLAFPMNSMAFHPFVKSESFQVIFKVGNDLRQDQFVMHLIEFIEKILLDADIDMKITSYKVLATSTNSGFVEYVESVAIGDVIGEHGSILKYLSILSKNSRKSLSFLIENFTKSCAFYSVFTYILGVGDRHLDNILLTKEGTIFHVDFAYILGQDPKPLLPPPMKLSKEMIEAMRGLKSTNYQQFKSFCQTVYLQLRRNADLFLSLLNLMSSSNLPSFVQLQQKLKQKQQRSAFHSYQLVNQSDEFYDEDIMSKFVKDKLRLDLNEMEASKHIEQIVNIASSDFMGSVVERMHRWSQAMKT